MTQNSKPTGRPTFRIDADMLRALRKDAGRSQEELAQKVYSRAGKGTTNVGVMKTSAYRWEKSGAIRPDLARHLAAELNTTLAVLQGALPEPEPSRVDVIEERIQMLFSTGPSHELKAALEQCMDYEMPVRELATRLTSRLEVAQLSQEQDELQELAKLTGFSAGELRQPMSHDGFWLLIGSGHTGSDRSEILSRLDGIHYEVSKEIKSYLERFNESDTKVSFKREKHWFHITLVHARLLQLNRTLRFVRCQVNETGLQWKSPTPQEQARLKALPRETYWQANFVTGFDSIQVPAQCTNLRLAITKDTVTQDRDGPGLNERAEIMLLTEGNITELPSKTLEAFRQEGSTHDLVVSWLAADLWDKLLPFLSEWPLECWHLAAAQTRIDVNLEVPYRFLADKGVLPRMGNRLSLRLVELLADGALKPAPWSNQSVARIHETLAKSLQMAREAQTQATSRLPAA